MPNTPLLLALLAAALAVGSLLGALAYARFVIPANRRVRHLESQITHLTRQLASPRTLDLRPLVDTLPDPVIYVDAHDQVLLLNAAASRLLQLPGSSVVNKPLVSVVTDQALLDLFDSVHQTSDPAHPHPPLAQRQLKITRSGTRFVYQAVAVRTENNSVLLVLRDVTHMASIVQMKTDFVSNAGHELRTPIAAIKIAFETLRDVIDDDPVQTKKCVGIIDGHIRRLEEMLSDLLDLSRVESPDMQAQIRPIRAGEAFSMIAPTLTPVAREKGLDLVFHSPDDGNQAFCTDPRLLNLILKNLVENSIKFTPSGGKVTVTISPQYTPPQGGPDSLSGASGSSSSAPNPGFTLTVADTGIGIAPEHLPRVFERFYQVDPARTGSSSRGTGLGLAIVKHATHALGGSISLQSTPGQGTTISCTFPPTTAPALTETAST